MINEGLPELLGSHSRVLTKIFIEKREVAEAQCESDFLDAHVGRLEPGFRVHGNDG